MKLAIIGSRTFKKKLFFWSETDKIIADKEVTHIVSGGCPHGADNLAEIYARGKQIPITIYYAQWKKYESSDSKKKNPAGMIRNKQIVDDCDVLLAFWDGQSKGTKNSIDLALKQGKEVIIKW